MKTLQETFNIVKSHLLKQNKRCAEDDVCLYRNDEGLKCAVGALINDDEYRSEHNELGLHTGLVKNMLTASGVSTDRESMDLMHDLQSTHDQIEPEKWEAGLKLTAVKYNLNY